MGEQIKMWLEGIFVKKVKERFKESFCFILLGAGIILLFYHIDQSHLFDPTNMQNLLLLMIGCFGSYVFLMDLFFDEKRKPLIQKHLTIVIVILLILGALSVVNVATKGIEIENMVYKLPFIDSAVFLLFTFFFMIFLAFLTADGIIVLVKKAKKTLITIRNKTTEVGEEEE